MRTYKKKTGRGNTSKEDMEEAVRRVLNNNESTRSVANAMNICHVTLGRYVKKVKISREADGVIALTHIGYRSSPVFNQEQTKKLVDYLKYASKIYFGLTPKEVRKLAYECASRYGLTVPEPWHKNKCAGEDWLTTF